MKNWIPVLLLAGAVAADAGEEPGNQDPLRQVQEQALEQDTIRPSRVITGYFYAGVPQVGTFAVVPFDEPFGTIASLISGDRKKSIALSINDGEPAIVARKDEQYVVIPLFALAEHLGIQPEGKVKEQEDQAKPSEVPENPAKN